MFSEKAHLSKITSRRRDFRKRANIKIIWNCTNWKASDILVENHQESPTACSDGDFRYRRDGRRKSPISGMVKFSGIRLMCPFPRFYAP